MLPNSWRAKRRAACSASSKRYEGVWEIGTARALVAGSRSWPPCTARVAKCCGLLSFPLLDIGCSFFLSKFFRAKSKNPRSQGPWVVRNFGLPNLLLVCRSLNPRPGTHVHTHGHDHSRILGDRQHSQ